MRTEVDRTRRGRRQERRLVAWQYRTYRTPRRCWIAGGWLSLLWLPGLARRSSADDPRRPTAAERLVASPRVLIIAHRGASKQAPENTLPAFQLAIRHRADLVELDYLHSADGTPVVFHDEKLDRTTDAERLFGPQVLTSSRTLAELRRLDAGGWFAPAYRGTRIPTLDEALEVIQAGSMTLIERKGGDAATCVRLLARKSRLGEVVVQSFDWQFLQRCHRLAPQLMLGALGKESLTERDLDRIAETGARVVGWDHEKIGKAEIEALHRRGWKAWVFTVNDVTRARRLVREGIDGLITDVPDRMRRALRLQ